MTLRVSRNSIPIIATTLVCIVLYAAAAMRYPGFFSYAVFVNFLRDNAFLGLAALGMTFVILSGGIDLSVGAMIGFTSIFAATVIEQSGLHPLIVAGLALLVGVGFGAGQGALVHFFRLPPFLVTLGGMFLARGLAFMISLESITIAHPFYSSVADVSYEYFPVSATILLVAAAGAIYLAHWTRFGRNTYAIGGSESSALLMGLPVGRTKVMIYALSGLCSAAAGIVYTFYTSSGNATAGTMLELDAIATVVIGGTLLSGGVGYVTGTLVGVLIYGIIQTSIVFEGTLSPWWTRIVIGVLLLTFILLQKLVQRRAAARA